MPAALKSAIDAAKQVTLSTLNERQKKLEDYDAAGTAFSNKDLLKLSKSDINSAKVMNLRAHSGITMAGFPRSQRYTTSF